jgi:hypothetical protein
VRQQLPQQAPQQQASGDELRPTPGRGDGLEAFEFGSRKPRKRKLRGVSVGEVNRIGP